MSTPATPDPAQTLTGRFLAATASARRRPLRPKVENDEFLAGVWRMVRALERRTIDDPTLLPQAVALAQRLAEVTNVAIYANAERYEIDPMLGASMAECARILGVSKQAASQRKQLGKGIMLGRIAAAGAIPFAEAKREKEAIRAAATHAVTVLSEYRAKHRKSA